MFKKKVGRPSNKYLRRKRNIRLFGLGLIVILISVTFVKLSDYLSGDNIFKLSGNVSWTYNGYRYTCPKDTKNYFYTKYSNDSCAATGIMRMGTTCDYKKNKDNSYKGYNYRSDTKMCEKLASPLIDSYIPAKEHKATTSNACKNMKGLSTGKGVTASCWTCDNGKKPFEKGTNNFVCGSTKSCPATMKLHQRSDGCYDVKKLKSYMYCPSPGVEKNGKCVYTVAAVKTNAHVLTAWAISKDKMKLHINPNANVKSIDSCVFEKATSSEKIYSCPIHDGYIVRLNDGSTTEINMKEAINQYQANEEAANTPDSTDTTTGGTGTTSGSSTVAATYTVTYDPNGAKGNQWSEQATYGKNYKTQDNWYKRTGYKFKGWNESADGTGVDWTAWINKDWNWTYSKNVTLNSANGV